MSKTDDTFERFCSFDALYDSSYKVCRNVRWKDSTINFEENRIDTILSTEADLRANEYEQLVFSCFSIIERGKPRDIRACHINDRLVQNALCEQSLLPELTPKFIYDNCATLRDRGIHFAINRMKYHLRKAHQEYGIGKPFFGVRIDIRKYFDSINHEALKEAARLAIKDDRIYELCCYLINTFSFRPTKDKVPAPNKVYYINKNRKYQRVYVSRFLEKHRYYEYEEKSLGLGSQTSQLFALLALNEVDHFVKEKLHIKYYGRYMDDLYLLHNDSKYLADCVKQIEQKLNDIGLSMNNKKTAITRITSIKGSTKGETPLKYLKWNFYLTDTNRVIIIPFAKKLSHQRRKLRKMHNLWTQGLLSTYEVQKSYAGWRAHMEVGNCFYIIQEMDNYFHSLFKGVEIIR